ncbi:MAG: hypothetical protein RLZZ299_2412 [Pseudomonadota bacterium]
MTQRAAVIIGAGPAGLTTALELLRRSDIRPIVLEASGAMGGISQTAVHNGNRIDIGGHRFFSKVDRVMDWWRDILPVQGAVGAHAQLAYQGAARTLPLGDGPDPAREDAVMLVRPRRSRIYYLGQFFDYPVRASPDTLRKLGARRTARIAATYARARVRPRAEHSLEDFLVNRFGTELYETFFREYTEKVWGVPCARISPEWGAQRIKGLDLGRALSHFLRQLVPAGPSDLAQKTTETSLIEQFLYPKLGPGQMWEAVADCVRAAGGDIRTGWRVVEVRVDATGRRATGVVAEDRDGVRHRLDAEHVVSTMPMQDLVRAMAPTARPPEDVRDVSEGLLYRDFFTVGLLVDRLALHDVVDGRRVPISDNWIYVQEPGVHVGRMQIFNNWSPWMVADPSKTWIGLEYFCNVGDALWSRSDEALMDLAVDEADRIGILARGCVRDRCILRMPKTYPAYFGSYDRFGTLRDWLDRVENLHLVGRNGMHRYNNQDHSMLTAMVTVDQLVAGRFDKNAIWSINTEQDYHEEKR